MYISWLADVLKKAGLKVVEEANWEARGHGQMNPPVGVICHHTGGALKGNSPSLEVVKFGRPDLMGPLAQLFLARDGTFHVVAAGLCWHAGAGEFHHITAGNMNFIGIEAENTGLSNDPWPAAQMKAYAKGVAAILHQLSADRHMCIGHKEWALPKGRKDDPSFDMDKFRWSVGVAMDKLVAKIGPPRGPREFRRTA